MAHDFFIGKPNWEVTTRDGDDAIVPFTETLATEDIHMDEYDLYEDSTRFPGFRQWREVLADLPVFEELWDDLYEYAIRHYDPEWIPIAYYEDRLDAVEQEAIEATHDPEREPAAQRALWFVRWSRHAIEEFGEDAVFETPKEWNLSRMNPTL